MLLTEEEAKKKWCCGPPCIAAILMESDINEMMTTRCRCGASRCAAWRWADPATKQETVSTIQQIKEEFGVDVDRAEVRQVPFGPERRGYCGLAGKVEVA